MIMRCLLSSAVFRSVTARTENIFTSGHKPEITKGNNSTVYRVRMSNHREIQTISSTGKHRVKIDSRSEFYCYTHSPISTTYVTSPPVGGSNHKKIQGKVIAESLTKKVTFPFPVSAVRILDLFLINYILP